MKDTLDELRVEPLTGLSYRLRPAGDGAGKAPCLLLLHGVGANEMGLIDLARRMDPRLVVILPRGPLVLGPGAFAWFRVGFTPAGPVIDAGQAERARTLLDDFIGQLPAAHRVDPDRIWIGGFSQGGIMSASVGLTVPERVAGFAILSGRVLPEVLPKVVRGPALERLRAFVSHGVDDQTLGIHHARTARDVLGSFGLGLAYHEYAGGHALTRPMVEDFQQWLANELTRSEHGNEN